MVAVEAGVAWACFLKPNLTFEPAAAIDRDASHLALCSGSQGFANPTCQRGSSREALPERVGLGQVPLKPR